MTKLLEAIQDKGARVIMTSRRSVLTGIASLIAAPAIVRASSLMPVSVVPVSGYVGIGNVGLGTTNPNAILDIESLDLGEGYKMALRWIIQEVGA